jgi:hypothetical protein
MVIVNLDGPGEGFNDLTPVAPEGGNNGTTRGQQRLNVFQAAANVWGNALLTSRTIRIGANFDIIENEPGEPCNQADGGVLGQAGPNGSIAFFTAPPGGFANIFYALPLAETLVNQEIDDPDIFTTFNTDVDNGCLFPGSRFWYGIDSTPVPGLRVALFPTVLHELAHGLGFTSLVCVNVVNGMPANCDTNRPFGSYPGTPATPDIWARFLGSRSSTQLFQNMTNAQRAATITSNGDLVWFGTNVTNALPQFQPSGPGLNNGRIRMYAPNPAEPGSSVAHFDETANPNLLMEPNADDDVFAQTDLTIPLLQDIGWQVNGTPPPVNLPPTVSQPVSNQLTVTEDVASSLAGIVFADADAGTGALTATFSVTQGTVSATAMPGVVVAGTPTARTLSGQLTALNAYIAAGNLRYTTAQDSTLAQTLGVAINDNGNTGTGGPQTGSRNVTLSVSIVNDAPTVNAPPGYAANEDVITPLAGITVADIDAGANQVTLTATVTAGTFNLTGGGVNVTGSGTATVTLTGTIAAINTYIAGSNLRYQTAQNGTANATLDLTINDFGASGGGALTATDSATITVTAVNDPPSVTGPATIAAQAGAQTSITGVTFADLDAASGNLTVTWAVTAGTMSAIAGGGITVNSSGTNSMTTTGTLANLIAFVAGANVKFDAPGGTADVTLTVTANDNGNTGSGGALSAIRQITLSLSQIFSDGFETP